MQKTIVASTDDMDANCGAELITNLLKALKTNDIALFGEMIANLQAHSFAAMRAVKGELFETNYQNIFYEVMQNKGPFA